MLRVPFALRNTVTDPNCSGPAPNCPRTTTVSVQRGVVALADDAPLWITTEKDAVKLLPAWLGRARVAVLVIELEVEQAEPWLDWVEAQLRSHSG